MTSTRRGTAGTPERGRGAGTRRKPARAKETVRPGPAERGKRTEEPVERPEAALPSVPDLPEPPSGWVSLPDLAARLEVPLTKVQQMVKDGLLIAVRHDGGLSVPAELVAGRTALKHLPGVLTLLRDAGYSDSEALTWLYTPDDTLPGTPASALSGPGATEVKRRAQALGF